MVKISHVKTHKLVPRYRYRNPKLCHVMVVYFHGHEKSKDKDERERERERETDTGR